MKRYKHKQEHIDFVRENVKGISLRELRKRFNERFNCNVSDSVIENIKGKHKLKSGIQGGQYHKGNIPLNKGTKGMFNVGGNKTSFKKGNVPVNHRPVGSERVNVDGYVEIKIKDPNKWDLKHRVIYKRLHGDIPKDSVIIFADGNKHNLDIDNLVAITRNEHARLNQNGLRFDDGDITKSALNLAKLIIKTNEAKKRKDKYE